MFSFVASSRVSSSVCGTNSCRGGSSKRIVTGYPWYAITTPEHKKFLTEYQAKYNDYPRIGSIVGYTTLMAAVAGVRKAKSTDTEKLIAAFEGLEFESPFGKVKFRAQDHQSTLGAYVGKTALKDGKGIMVDFRYADGADFQPSDADVKKMRPQD